MPRSRAHASGNTTQNVGIELYGVSEREEYADREALVQTIENYIHYYNTKRLQRRLGVLTPMEKHTLCLAA